MVLIGVVLATLSAAKILRAEADVPNTVEAPIRKSSTPSREIAPSGNTDVDHVGLDAAAV